MAIDDDVRAVYEYLTTPVLPGANRPTVTYGQIEQETGVRIGKSPRLQWSGRGMMAKSTGILGGRDPMVPQWIAREGR